MKNEISVMSWDAPSILDKTDELLTITRDYDTDVVLLQETILTPTKKYFIPGYKITDLTL